MGIIATKRLSVISINYELIALGQQKSSGMVEVRAACGGVGEKQGF
jgi:hypothetical protein